MNIRRLAALAFDGVERADPDGPPTSFRIWRAGDNTTDHGPTFFTERSAALLMEQQARRGNRFSVDINHLSLNKDAPLENQRAVGWFDIEVRGGELWAVNVEWTDTVSAGLAKDPPEWRYHSPAYDVDAKTGEVLSLTNLALTNNPATWSVTALATREAKGNSNMKLEDIKAAFEGADDEKKAKAWAAIAAAMASDGDKPAEPDGDESEKKDAKKAEGDEPEKKDSKKAEGDEPEKSDMKKCEGDEPEKKDAKATKATSALASMIADQDAALKKAMARIAELEKKDESVERKALIASRDMTPELAKKLAGKPLGLVREICETLPQKATRTSASTEGVTGTPGAGQGDGTASALPPEERRKLDERMGLRKIEASVKNEGVHQIFPTLTPAEARRMLAAKSAKGDK